MKFTLEISPEELRELVGADVLVTLGQEAVQKNIEHSVQSFYKNFWNFAQPPKDE